MPGSLSEGITQRGAKFKKIVKFLAGADVRFDVAAKLRIPVVAGLAGTCVVGEIVTNGADANKLYQCTAANTWTKVGTQA